MSRSGLFSRTTAMRSLRSTTTVCPVLVMPCSLDYRSIDRLAFRAMPVRDAVSTDIDEICSLIEEHARYEGNDELRLDRAEMARHLFGPDPKAWVVLAENEAGEVAGMAFCSWSFSTWEARPGIWLDDLYVRPENRRSGLGRELLDALRARTDGRVEWDMQEGNDRAAAFYADLGARPVSGWVRYRWRA